MDSHAVNVCLWIYFTISAIISVITILLLANSQGEEEIKKALITAGALLFSWTVIIELIMLGIAFANWIE